MKKFELKEIESILTPPGNGVFTVKTAEDVIAGVQGRNISRKDKEKIISLWKKSLSEMKAQNSLTFRCL